MERPSWWSYPSKCSRGHEWGPGKVIVSWTPCDCQPAKDSGQLGHQTVSCQEPGCRCRWYRPRHDPATASPFAYPRRGLCPEGSLPSRYALIIGGGLVTPKR
jgi:hypothetical protein